MPENHPYRHHLDARHGSGDTSSREWDVNAEWYLIRMTAPGEYRAYKWQELAE